MLVKEKLDRTVSDFIWNIVEIHSQLEEIHNCWAQLLGITEPQWLMLMAINELDEGNGVSGIAVANKLHIHPAFVTNQTKRLESMEFLSRVTSPDDARYLRISLTHKARAQIETLSSKRQALNSTMFDGLDEESLHYLNRRLTLIAKSTRLASQKLSIGIL
ncbi:MarR family winged helix-turn-helix transcriptional regulator [Bradyrhizobium valentinum]|uniref:MarR family winged helix-turn-helix transcriptional regulator n=1 Tax=Bradyrhizobium valentinum TaxID=1518501 RepID=UPI00070EA8AF|nr:MarR family transcriptional regulator [Bradyrhizobium valentinum]KRR06799.1 transcriptional regulator [Bradyrhizobium valentinum]